MQGRNRPESQSPRIQVVVCNTVDVISYPNRRKLCWDVGISLLLYAKEKHRKLRLHLRQNKRNMHPALLGEAAATSYKSTFFFYNI